MTLSEPLPSGDGYLWILTDKERSHIASMLDCDAQNLPLKGNKMVQDRETCSTCSKPSGLDDLVQNALALGIHSTSFMLDILQHGPKNDSPGHEVTCSCCGERFKTTFWWIPSEPW